MSVSPHAPVSPGRHGGVFPTVRHNPPSLHKIGSGTAGFEPASLLYKFRLISSGKTGTELTRDSIAPLYHLSYVPHDRFKVNRCRTSRIFGLTFAAGFG